ncbi:hypothetical protein HY030_03740 [Candidatus Gottesmanbacteria bacterium]|nr:hypothetical protein [Candidatus Gottesmanbacteria bacterium]
MRVVAKDPGDDKFIACAISGNANYLVSGDKHLLEMNNYHGLKILSPKGFLALLPALTL